MKGLLLTSWVLQISGGENPPEDDGKRFPSFLYPLEKVR